MAEAQVVGQIDQYFGNRNVYAAVFAISDHQVHAAAIYYALPKLSHYRIHVDEVGTDHIGNSGVPELVACGLEFRN